MLVIFKRVLGFDSAGIFFLPNAVHLADDEVVENLDILSVFP